MKKILRSVMFVLAVISMATPAMYAQRHQGDRGNNSRTERTNHGNGPSGRPGLGGNSHGNGNHNSRPNNGNTQNGNHNNRPGNRPAVTPSVGNGGNNHNNRPSVGNANHNNNRPSVGTSGRPGINGNHNRPTVGGNNHRPEVRPTPAAPARPGAIRPGVANRPGIVNRPGGPIHSRPPMIAPPHRPFRPVIARPVYRPVPPPAWRPRPGIPVIRGILGLTFGAAFNVSLDYLYNQGYTVDGYGNNIVYLRNVPMLNYVWTDGALYYGNNGLDASSFYYSTPGYDLSRYNSVYSSLVNTYGMPVSVNNAAGSMSATWFGGNNGYVTLSFGSGQAGRFLTTLTFGL